MLLVVVVILKVFQVRVSLSSPDYLETHSVDLVSLELRDLPSSASSVLGRCAPHCLGRCGFPEEDSFFNSPSGDNV